MLKPATLLSSARTAPRCFFPNEKYSCFVNVACTKAYFSPRLCPVNSISTLPLRKSVIFPGVRSPTLSMRIRIHPVAWQIPNFRITLHWKRCAFQDHLVLDKVVIYLTQVATTC